MIQPKKKRKNRDIQSHLHTKVVNLAIVPRMTQYQKKRQEQKLQEKINMVKAQHGDDLKSSTMTFGVNKPPYKPKPQQTQRIDLRQ